MTFSNSFPAEMVKNVSYTDKPRYEHILHQHIYHTVDSTGRKLDNCAPVGTHFHVMTVKHQGDGKAPVVTCSPAVHYVMKKINGQMEKVIEAKETDTHSHEVQYLGSERIKIQTTKNPEFIKFQAAMESKITKLEGVIEQ